MTDKPMTVGELIEQLKGYPDDMPVKVYATEYLEFEIPEYSYRECNCEIDSINKVSELTKPENDYVRIELCNQRF